MPVLIDKVSRGHHLFEEAKKEVVRMPNATSDSYIAIGLINNMPDSALVATERQVFELLRAAAADDIPIHLKFYALPNITRTDWGREYMSRAYSGLDDLYDSELDAVIVTGAEPQAFNLGDEPYWEELSSVIDWAADTTASAIWSCLAVHAAVLHFDGINRRPLGEKCIGIFEQQKVTDHPILEGTPTTLLMPHSRWNEIREEALLSCGYSVLTKSADAGVGAFIKQQRQSLFVYFQGHPEYEALSLLGEYRRDIGRFLRKEMETYPTNPRGYFNEEAEELLADFRRRALYERRKELLATFPLEPISASLTNTWRSASVKIYRNWLSHVSKHKASSRSVPTFFHAQQLTTGPLCRERQVSQPLSSTAPATDSVINEICAFPWSSLSSEEMVSVAWAYYFFSIQFRESLKAALTVFPADANLRRLDAEECDTDNLSPWPGVASPGERMNHDEFMRRALALLPLEPEKISTSKAIGKRYLAATRAMSLDVRAASIASYEDGGLESVFRSMLTFEHWDNALLHAFRHFLTEHVRFDSESDQSHGALSRHISFDDRIQPLWRSFRDLLAESVAATSSTKLRARLNGHENSGSAPASIDTQPDELLGREQR